MSTDAAAVSSLMPHQRVAASFLAERGFAMLLDDPGLGKAQPIDCTIMTPEGPVLMGSIKVGDYVIGSNGEPTLVTGVYPQGVRKVWKIYFSDGTFTRCCSEHLWAVNSHNRMRRGLKNWVVKSTENIINPTDKRIKEPIRGKDGRYRWYVPVTKAVHFVKKNLPLDPYVLGCILGDGGITGKNSVRVFSKDYDMFEEIIRRIKFTEVVFRISDEHKCPCMNIHGYKTGTPQKSNKVLLVLRQLGLQGRSSFTKFVPTDYLSSDIEDRTWLLRGMMDTDGYISKNNTVQFGSRSQALAAGVAFLARSLGAVARENTQHKVGKPFYSVTIAMPNDINPFFIARKAKKWKPRPKYSPQKGIANIVPDVSVECQCISVAASDHLYLTSDFIVTHNTAAAVAGADLRCALRILVLCPAVVKVHWAREFTRWQTIPRPVTITDGFLKAPPGAGVTIASHACIAHTPSVNQIRMGAPYDVIIVDEFHAFRAYNANRTQNLLTPQSGIFQWTQCFWALTGTPVVNSAGDLWPTFFGPMRRPADWWEFCNFYTNIKNGSDGPKPVGIKNEDILADLMRPFVLRRTLESVGIQLPSLHFHTVDVPIDKKIMTEVLADLEVWSPQRLSAALENNDDLKDTALARVRQVLGLAKVDAVATEAYNLLKAGDGPIVIFFQHTRVRERLYELLSTHAGYQVSWIDGKITQTQLTAAETWFQAGKLNVLLVQTQAGGQGITLHRSNLVIHSEYPWTSVALYQATKRVHRIGQTRPCDAIMMRAKGCWLEDLLSSVVTMKQRASDKLLALLTTSN